MSILTLIPDAQLMTKMAWLLSLSGSSALVSHLQRRWLKQSAIIPLHVACKIVLTSWGFALFGFSGSGFCRVSSLLEILPCSVLFALVWFAIEKHWNKNHLRNDPTAHHTHSGGYPAPRHTREGGYPAPRHTRVGEYPAPRHAREGEYPAPRHARAGGYPAPRHTRVGGYPEKTFYNSKNLLIMLIVIAIFEELLFRQLLFVHVLSDWPLVERAVFVSILFALSHIGLGLSQCFIKFCFSLYLCFLLWLFGSVLICIFVHVGFNALVYRHNERRLIAAIG